MNLPKGTTVGSTVRAALLILVASLALVSPSRAQTRGGGIATTPDSSPPSSMPTTSESPGAEAPASSHEAPTPDPYLEGGGGTTGTASSGARTEAPEEDGDGRSADLLWIEAGLGYSYVDLVQFSNDNFLPEVDRFAGSGFAATVAAGVRIFILTLGARASLASYEGFEVGTAVLDIGLRLPTPVVEPYARLGLGYGWVGNADYGSPGDSDTSVYGLVLEGGVGVDIYITDILTIGGGLDAAFLNLSRQRVDMGCGMGACSVDTVDFEEDGDAAGLQMRLTAHVGLHF